jgi:hypothetical protein
MSKQITGLLWAAMLLCHLSAFCQPFQFDDPNSWEVIKPCEFIATGSHKLSNDEHTWIFLKDRFTHMYLQYPKVQFTLPGQWEAPNVRGNEGTRYVVAVVVNSKGNKEIERWVQGERWGSIPETEVKALKGYRQLSAVPVSWRTCVLRDTNEGCNPNLLTANLEIANFEGGATSIQGGQLSTWQSSKKVEVNLGTQAVKSDSERLGQGAAFVRITPSRIREDWVGAGLVIPLTANDGSMNLECYGHLEFDLRVAAESQFAEVRIKLEDTKGTNRPERLVNNYGHALSQEWQHYRIPLPELIEKKKDDQKHWAEGDQKAIKKIVLVLKSKKEDGQFGGELWIDNVTFIKK